MGVAMASQLSPAPLVLFLRRLPARSGLSWPPLRRRGTPCLAAYVGTSARGSTSEGVEGEGGEEPANFSSFISLYTYLCKCLAFFLRYCDAFKYFSSQEGSGQVNPHYTRKERARVSSVTFTL